MEREGGHHGVNGASDLKKGTLAKNDPVPETRQSLGSLFEHARVDVPKFHCAGGVPLEEALGESPCSCAEVEDTVERTASDHGSDCLVDHLVVAADEAPDRRVVVG